MRSRIRGLFVEGARSIVGTPRTKTGKNFSEWLFVALLSAACFSGLFIFGLMIGYP